MRFEQAWGVLEQSLLKATEGTMYPQYMENTRRAPRREPRAHARSCTLMQAVN